MKTSGIRTLLVLGTLACTTATASAEGRQSLLDVGQRIWGQQYDGHDDTADSGIRQVSYMPEVYASDDVLPMGYEGPYAGGSYGGCPCGECSGGYCGDGNCGSGCCGDCYPACGYAGGHPGHHHAPGMWYAEVQNIAMRAHVAEQAIGKLSEKYEYSPRIVVGCEIPAGLGVRARYWKYHRTTPNLSGGPDLRMEFDVLDFEGTCRFRTKRSDLVVAGGFRYAAMDFDTDPGSVRAEMPGITFAADLRSWLFRGCHSEFATVCGARWALLGGDWRGDTFAFFLPTRDDNVVVHEYYAGVEYLHRFHSCNAYARLVFEVQNWHSDAMAQSGGTDSIGFLGPALQGGVTF